MMSGFARTTSASPAARTLPAIIAVLALADGVVHLSLDFVLFRGNFFGSGAPPGPPPGGAPRGSGPPPGGGPAVPSRSAPIVTSVTVARYLGTFTISLKGRCESALNLGWRW